MNTPITFGPFPQMRSLRWRPAQSSYERLSARLDENAEAEGKTAHAEQIEMLGRSIFGELWDPRSTPEQDSVADSVET